MQPKLALPICKGTGDIDPLILWRIPPFNDRGNLGHVGGRLWHVSLKLIRLFFFVHIAADHARSSWDVTVGLIAVNR